LPPRIGRKGSSLVEVLTAVAIFGIIMVSAMATFSFQRQSYTAQTRVAEMQQNLRAAMDALLRDLRMGGYGLASNIVVPATVVGGSSGTVSLRGYYDGDGGASSPDGIYILYTYDMDNTVAALRPTVTTGAVTANGPISVAVTPGTGTRFPVGGLVVLNNGTSADMYQVTASDNNSVTFGTNIYNAAANHLASNVYEAGSKVSFARFVHYFLDTTNASHPTLMVLRLPGTVPQPVADDIEDLQFSYGLGATADNALVSGSPVDSPSDAQLPLFRRINLSIVARSGIKEKGWQGQRPNIGNRTGTAPTDTYRRRVLQNLAVEIRNVRLVP
jgi:type II secretory pathway pseudopilin PulG